VKVVSALEASFEASSNLLRQKIALIADNPTSLPSPYRTLELAQKLVWGKEYMASEILKSALPSPSSLAFRASLSRLISPLRRVRPRVPFYDLAIHRTPTLALYRNLLRYAPDDNVGDR
jgi:hypothetical protein